MFLTDLRRLAALGRRPATRAAAACAVAALLGACGGGGGAPSGSGPDPTASTPGGSGSTPTSPTPATPTTPSMSTLDAVRLAQQASFGPSEALVADIASQGAAAWVAGQITRTGSRYTLGGSDAVHRTSGAFCGDGSDDNCWRDNFTGIPLLWEFYRNAIGQPDQLRQRVAWALQQILVVSDREVFGTYGHRNYQNRLLELAFGNYREVLRAVTLSPVMGDYLNHVNNHYNAPNENYARELLQLFAIGTCELQPDGSFVGGSCKPTYNNDTVRAYAYALTGWTYPAGGSASGGCWPRGTNCRYYGGLMTALPAFRDPAERRLLSGVTVPAGSTADQALNAVLDSLMAHPSMAPFVGRQLIQHLVSSNPSPAYVQRVSQAFTAGRHMVGGQTFGQGQRGDLAATVAAVLLDEEARGAPTRSTGGRLREPVLHFTGVVRALNGRSDGQAMGWWWGDALGQRVFGAPSVFNFYPPDYPVSGTSLVGPAFAIQNSSTGVNRLNFLTFLLFWNGADPVSDVPGATGTRADLSAFQADAGDPAKLVDRLSILALGEPLPATARQAVIQSVTAVGPGNTATADVPRDRVREAAYLVFAGPRYHVIR